MQKPSLPLSVDKVLEIKNLYSEICRYGKDALKNVIRIGELLYQAKQNMKHGEWSDWVFSSAPFSLSCADRWIKIYLNRDKLDCDTIFGVSDALKLIESSLEDEPPEDSQTPQSAESPPSKSTTYNARDSKNQPPSQSDQTFKFDPPTSRNGSEKPVIELDEIGIPIPEDGLPFWARKQEIQDLLTQISRIKCTIEEAKNSNDPMFARVSNSAISQLRLVHTMVSEAKPYAVCTTCMGRFTVQPKGCSFCGDKGLISKYQWDVQSRKEVKEMRMKMAAKRACTIS